MIELFHELFQKAMFDCQMVVQLTPREPYMDSDLIGFGGRLCSYHGHSGVPC